MKVKDLIKKLSSLDPGLDILCYSEDEKLLPEGHLFRLLEIESVDIAVGEKCKGSDGVGSLKLGQSALSEKHVTINVTCDF